MLRSAACTSQLQPVSGGPSVAEQHRFPKRAPEDEECAVNRLRQRPRHHQLALLRLRPCGWQLAAAGWAHRRCQGRAGQPVAAACAGRQQRSAWPSQQPSADWVTAAAAAAHHLVRARQVRLAVRPPLVQDVRHVLVLRGQGNHGGHPQEDCHPPPSSHHVCGLQPLPQVPLSSPHQLHSCMAPAARGTTATHPQQTPAAEGSREARVRGECWQQAASQGGGGGGRAARAGANRRLSSTGAYLSELQFGCGAIRAGRTAPATARPRFQPAQSALPHT